MPKYSRLIFERCADVPGVVAVYTGRDTHPDGPEPSDRHHSMLARDKAIYYGQPVAVVVATSTPLPRRQSTS